MATAKCLKNIAEKKPPYNTACSSEWCQHISYGTGQHCTAMGLSGDDPVLTFDEDEKKYCYCCCSCFTLGTPIAVLPGRYALIENINAGDEILATGLGLEWKICTVAERSGSVDRSVIPGLLYVAYRVAGEYENRHLLVTPDHPFLLYDPRILKLSQHLIPGDRLMGVDGEAAVVQFVLLGSNFTSIQSIEMDGEVRPDSLDGHLLDSNGVVTADYAVQVTLETSGLPRFSLPADQKCHEAGSVEYAEKYHGNEVEEFLNSPEMWPKGFVPYEAKRNWIIPATAMRYLDDARAEQVYQNAIFRPRSSSVGQSDVLYLFKRCKELCPEVICILDWADEVPNAYAWKANRQQYLVVSGGLVRLKGFFLDGMAFVIASMLVALRQPGCVCEWDFQATRDILRSLWPDFMLPDIMRDGMAQIEHLFSFINDKEAGKDPCLQPSLACRLKSYASGFNFTELPDCAGLYPQFLTVTTAYINIDNTVLYMGFNDTLDQSAAENPRNYALSPEVEISAVSLDEQNPKAVRLTLKDVKPGCAFALSLGALMSSHGRPLAADQRQHVVNSHQPSTGS